MYKKKTQTVCHAVEKSFKQTAKKNIVLVNCTTQDRKQDRATVRPSKGNSQSSMKKEAERRYMKERKMIMKKKKN
jgi:hypothetical protein